MRKIAVVYFTLLFHYTLKECSLHYKILITPKRGVLNHKKKFCGPVGLTGKRKGTSAKEKTRSEKVIEVVSRHSIGNARKQWSRFKPVERKPKGLQRTPKKAPRNHQTGGGRGLHDATWKGHSPKTL